MDVGDVEYNFERGITDDLQGLVKFGWAVPEEKMAKWCL
jgi:hypothetical protein